MLCSVNSVYPEYFSLTVHLLVCQTVFSVHFNAVRRVSITKLTIILELPAISKVFIFPSWGGEGMDGKRSAEF